MALQTTVPTTGLSVPAGLAVDAVGDLFIAVNSQSPCGRDQPLATALAELRPHQRGQHQL